MLEIYLPISEVDRITKEKLLSIFREKFKNLIMANSDYENK